MLDWRKVNWEAYEARVQMYVSEGMDHSDAEAVVDAELMREQSNEQSNQYSRN